MNHYENATTLLELAEMMGVQHRTLQGLIITKQGVVGVCKGMEAVKATTAEALNHPLQSLCNTKQ